MQDGCPVISIHPPLAGRDYRTTDNRGIKRHFNPPAPCGAGLGPWLQASERAYFNPPAPCGAGRALCVPTFCGKHFNPPAPCGAGLVLSKVNPPAPCGAGPPTRCSGTTSPDFNPPAPCGAGPGAQLGNRARLVFQSTRPLRGGTAILHKKTVQNIAYCTKSAFTLAVLSGFLALMRPFFLPNVHKFRCEPSEESLLAPRSHAYTIRTPSG